MSLQDFEWDASGPSLQFGVIGSLGILKHVTDHIRNTGLQDRAGPSGAHGPARHGGPPATGTLAHPQAERRLSPSAMCSCSI